MANQYRITFKRVEKFYTDIVIEAMSEDEARHKADQLSYHGEIEFDYLGESQVIDEYIVQVEKL